MSTRALQARIDCDRITLEALWRTHLVFHERLPKVIDALFRMRRGECGSTSDERDLYKRIGRFIISSSAQRADYLMNAVSKKDWEPASAKKYKITVPDASGKPVDISGETWADEAAALSAKGQLIFDKNALAGDLPGCMRQMLNREAVAVISSHDELVEQWSKEHKQWLDEKDKWESDPENGKYWKVRPEFEAFEKAVEGKITKRRGRWHLYLDWLRRNPHLAAWRGGPASINDISTAGQARIRRARPSKQRTIEAEEFWKANPELEALDRLHGDYERKFVRRRKTKRNPDGFDHRPTFTVPHPIRHPRWFVFNAPQTNPSGYRNLLLPTKNGERGSVELMLLTGDKNGGKKYPSDWVKCAFRADPRLLRFRRAHKSTIVRRGKGKGTSKTKDAYEFFDEHLRRWRPAEISGVKLIFRNIRVRGDGALLSAVPYLYFTCTIEDMPLTERALQISWSDTGEVTPKGKARKKADIPDGLVVCAVDLGLRHVGFATICVCEKGVPRVIRSRNIWLEDHGGGPVLERIAQHKREIRRLRRLRGKPVRGEQSHVELQDHITHMGEDRFKKAARRILNFAWNTDAARDASGAEYPRADVIVIERLEGFIPDAEKERGINRALAAWNRGQLVARLKEMAIDLGYKRRVYEILPHGTSQVCSRCGQMGRRYSITRDNPRRQPDIQFGWVEKLFACVCGYRANADHNASVNLCRRFIQRDAAVEAFLKWTDQATRDKEEAVKELEERLLPQLRKMHNLDSAKS